MQCDYLFFGRNKSRKRSVFLIQKKQVFSVVSVEIELAETTENKEIVIF